MVDKYLTVNEISIKLSVNPETVRRWIREGKLKSIQNSKKEGNLITESELLRFCKRYKKYYARFVEEPTTDVDDIFKAIEFHISEIIRLEQILKSREWG